MQCTGISGCFPREKLAAAVRRYPVFFVSRMQCSRVSVIHRANSDMDYRIVNVRTHRGFNLQAERRSLAADSLGGIYILITREL